MAQLKDSIVSGNLRVTDTILADILQADSIKGGIVATGTTWNGNTIDEIYGGTGQNTYAKGDLLYASAANTLSKLGANTGTKQFLSMTSSVPSWASIAFADIPALYIGTTKVQSSSTAQALTGITTGAFSSNVTIGGTLSVTSTATIGSTLTVNSAGSKFKGSAANILELYRTDTGGGAFIDYYYSGQTSNWWRVGPLADGKFAFIWKTNTYVAYLDANRNLYPATNTDSTTTQSLGTSSYRWNDLYTRRINASGLSTLSGGITLGTKYRPTGASADVDSKLVWDADHSAWHLIGNFYADGFVSAGGLSTGSGTSGIDWPALATNDSSHKIHVSHMPYVAGTTSDLTTGTSTTGTIWAAKTIADYVQSQVNTSVTSALYFRGESSTAITNGGTETATIDGSSLTAKTGDLVLYNGKEFAWDGSKWIQFGDESSWAAKTVKIEGTGYLSGGGTLESNRTIDIGSTYKTKIDNGATAYGYFSNNILPVSHGGTGKSTWTQYGIVYASASGTLAQIALPTWAASTTYWLKAVTNSSKVPTYSLATLSKSDVGLGNVENTALSTWTGTNKITKVGTVTTGTWNATAISAKYGGTGMSGDNAFTGAYRIVYTSSATAMTTLAPNTTSTKKFLTMTGTGSAGQAPTWDTVTKSDVGLGNVANSTYAGGTAITLNGTSKASSTASFYAPTASGTVSEVLLSGGANASPTWAKQSSLSTGFHPRALTSKGTTATTTAGETYGVAGDSTSGKRIFTKWFVNLDSGDTTLVDGMIITFRIPLAGLGTVGECITIDGNEQHFHQVVYNTNTLLTSHFAVNSVITVQYDSTISSNSYGKYDSSTGKYVHNGNTTTAIKGVWRVLSLYDSGNTDVRYQQTIYNINWSVPTDGAIRAYTLCMETPDGEFTSLTTTNNSTGTSKAMYSGYLKPRKVYYWAHTDNYSGGGTITRSNVMLTFNGGLIDYRYTLNCGQTLTAKSPLYLVGTIDDSGFKLDTTRPWSCTLPTTEDGKVYIYVGMTYDTYRGSLEENNTIYWYKDGAVRVYNYYAVKAETASKLSTISKTAWGQTYWTSNGIPATISGNMSNVGSISMSGSISGATTGSFSSNVTVGGTLTVGTATANKATTLNGTLSVTGLSTLAGGAKLTTTKKIWFGDTYYLELNSNGLHTNAGFYSDSFVSAGGLSDGSGTSGIDLDAMWQSLKNTSDSHGSDKIAAAHIPDMASTYGYLKSGDVSGVYLPLTGGTLTGSGSNDVLIKLSTESATSWMGFRPSDGTFRYIGINNSNELLFQYANRSYTLWHAGNFIAGTNYQAPISDLSTIRSNASNGNTAYGWGNHANAGYLLASTAASTYVSSVVLNGDYLRVTKNGANTDLTIPYASRAGYVDSTNSSNWDANSPGNYQYLWFYGQEGGVSNFPANLVGSYGSIVNFLSLGSSGSLHAQLAWGINHDSTNVSNGIAWRAKNNLGWDTTWHRLYDDNYHPTADNAGMLNGQPGSYYAAASSLSSYLPLAGGTMTGQLVIGGDTSLYFYGVPNVSYDYTIDNRTGFGILFKSTYEQDQGVLFSDYGDVTARKFIKRDGTSAQFLKADGTVDETSYLPLTGGTINGTSSSPLTINTSAVSNYLFFNTGNVQKAWVGYYPTDGMVLGNVVTGNYLELRDDGTIKYNNGSSGDKQVWWEGNSNTLGFEWDCSALGLASSNDSWNAVRNEQKIRFFFNTSTVSEGSPGAYYSGVSFMTAYNGMQFAVHGSYGNDTLMFRKSGDSEPYWGDWQSIYHSGNANLSTVPWTCANLTVGAPGSHGLIGCPYNASDINKYNYISFYGASSDGDIQYTAGTWTGGDHIAHRFLVGLGGSVDALTIKNNGYVGIGTTSPGYKLDVNGDFHTSGNIYIEQSGGIYCGPSGAGWRKIYGCDSDGGTYTRMASYAMLPDNDSNDCWQVRPWNGGYSSAYITVLQGGNVGIGTTSPGYKLDVNGVARCHYLHFLNTSGTGNAGYVGRGGSSSNNLQLTAGSGNGLGLGVNGIDDILFINTSGNVGIGTNSPAYTLDVNGYIGCSTLMASSDVSVSRILYFNTGDAFIARTTAITGSGVAGEIGVWCHDGSNFQKFRIWCSTTEVNGGVTVSGGALHITNTSGAQMVLGGYGTQGSSSWSQDGNPCLEFLNGTGYIDWHYYGSSNDYTSRIIEGSSGVLTLYGSWVATGAITAGSASDIRLKTNIQTLSTDSAKDIILKARPVNFTWKDIATELYDGYKGNDIGLIAQEVEDLLPQAIGTIFEKYKRLDYTKFIPPIITVIQDHEKRIKELEDIIAKLTEENNYLKEQI